MGSRASARGASRAVEPLTNDELVSRLTLYSTSLVDELYELATAKLDEEERRNESLRTRATALLSAAGLSITLALTFVGLLLQNGDYLRGLGAGFTITAVLLFALSFAFGIGGILKALKVMEVRGDYEQPNEHEIFNISELTSADALVDPFGRELPPPPQGEPSCRWALQTRNVPRECSRAESEKLAAAKYKRFLIPHLWGIATKHSSIHEQKAEWLRLSQKRFVLFLTGFTVMVGVLVAGVLARQLSDEGPATITCKIPVSTLTVEDARAAERSTVPACTAP